MNISILITNCSNFQYQYGKCQLQYYFLESLSKKFNSISLINIQTFNLKFQLLLSTVLYGLCNIVLSLLIYFGFYIAFNTVQVISGQVVMWAEETSKLYVTM